MALISKVSQRFSLHPNEGFITLGIFSIVSFGFQIFQHVGLTKFSLNPNEGFNFFRMRHGYDHCFDGLRKDSFVTDTS